MEKGIEKGRERGFTEGERKKAIEVAKRMVDKGFPIDEIKELTGLEEELILKLK